MEVKKIKTNDGWTIFVHNQPLLTYIVVNQIDDKIFISIPNCRSSIDGTKQILGAISRAIEEAEALLPGT